VCSSIPNPGSRIRLSSADTGRRFASTPLPLCPTVSKVNMEKSAAPDGRVRSERHEHVLKIIIDNVAKKNSFTPPMLEQMSDALTTLDQSDDLWVAWCAPRDPISLRA
jgi:hypothetical protein